MPNDLEANSEPKERQEQLSLYAFGLLERSDALNVEQRLISDLAWQSDWRLMQESLNMLAEQAEVPRSSLERLLARVHADRQTAPLQNHAPANLPLPSDKPRSPYFGPLLALALAVAITAILVLPRALSPEQQLAEYQAQSGAVTTLIKTKEGQNLGTAVRLKDGRAFILLAAEAPTGKAYQAWQVIGAAPKSLGVFKGRSFLSVPLRGGVTLAVSVEPPQGSPQPTTTPILAQLL